MAEDFLPARRVARPRAVLLTIGLAALGFLEALKMRADLKTSLDFFGYWVDARVGLVYGWSRIYDLRLVQVIAHSAGATHVVLTPQVPWLIWLSAPFALLPFQYAEAAWTALLLAAMVVAWILAAPGDGINKAAFGAAAFAATPTGLALVFGQASLLTAASLAAGYYLLRRDRQVAAGIAISGLLLKPHIAFLVPIVLLLIRPRAFVALAGTTLFLAIAAVLSLGPDGIAAYFRVLQINQDHSFVPVDLTLGGLGPLSFAVRLIVLALVARVVWLTRRGPLEIPLTAAIIGSLLVTPYEHTYDSVLLVVAAWMHWRARVGRADKAVLLLTYLVAFVEIPISGLVAIMECVWLGLLVLQAGGRSGVFLNSQERVDANPSKGPPGSGSP